MAVLTTYRGVLEKDRVVRLHQTPVLPVGTEVVVVAARPLPSIKGQKHRLATLSPEEWRKPFDAVRAAWDTSEPAPDEDSPPNDEGLVTLVHQAQEEHNACRRD